ncbi:MAG: dienelactone hydrolase family protein [Gemmataceae bacterium]
MRQLLSLCLALIAVAPLRAEILTKPVEYKDGPAALEGTLVHESSFPGKRPGVLLVHELGPNSAQGRSKALAIARLGYAVLNVDLYGKGTSADAAKLGKDRTLLRSRLAAARAALDKLPQVDPKRVAAVGYGAGGTAVLEHARAKGELEGAVCVHGDIAPAGKDGKNVSASLLVIVGADDPKVPLGSVAAFEDEMRAGGVDWQLLRFGGVAGDFTNPLAGKNLASGRAFDPDADQRSADAIKLFLAECFPPSKKAEPPAKAVAVPKGIPEKVLKVLEHVDKDGEAMAGYEGGRTFGNFEKRLPQNDAQGRRLKYREWDVNPLRPGVNRGPERLVTGSDGSAYYTDDHYDTFKKIRGGRP